MKNIKNLFKISYSKQELLNIKFLSQCKLFAGLSKEQLIKFLPKLYQRKFSKDEIIYYQNDPSQALYLVKSGEVEIQNADSPPDIIILKEHEAFGEEVFLENILRKNKATSLVNDTRLFIIPQAYLFKILKQQTIDEQLKENLK